MKKKMNQKKTCRIIDDFLKSADTENGYGFFKPEVLSLEDRSTDDVVDFALEVGKTHKRLYKKYQIVPIAFINYLKHNGLIPEDRDIDKKKRTPMALANILFEVRNQDPVVSGFSEYLREQLLRDLIPGIEATWGYWKNTRRRHVLPPPLEKNTRR